MNTSELGRAAPFPPTCQDTCWQLCVPKPPHSYPASSGLFTPVTQPLTALPAGSAPRRHLSSFPYCFCSCSSTNCPWPSSLPSPAAGLSAPFWTEAAASSEASLQPSLCLPNPSFAVPMRFIWHHVPNKELNLLLHLRPSTIQPHLPLFTFTSNQMEVFAILCLSGSLLVLSVSWSAFPSPAPSHPSRLRQMHLLHQPLYLPAGSNPSLPKS